MLYPVELRGLSHPVSRPMPTCFYRPLTDHPVRRHQTRGRVHLRLLAGPRPLAATAPSSAARPTPPSPITATLEPAWTRAVLMTAPTPVITAQPNRAASSSGSSRSIFTSERRDTTEYSANAEQPPSRR